MRKNNANSNNNNNNNETDVLLNRINQLEGQLGTIHTLLGELVNQQNEVSSITKKLETASLTQSPPPLPSNDIQATVLEKAVPVIVNQIAKEDEVVGEYYPAGPVVGSQVEQGDEDAPVPSRIKLTKEQRMMVKEQRKAIKSDRKMVRLERKNLKSLDKIRISGNDNPEKKTSKKDKVSRRIASDSVASSPALDTSSSTSIKKRVVKVKKDKMDKKDKQLDESKLKKMDKKDKKKLILEKRQERVNRNYSLYVSKMNKKNSNENGGKTLPIMNMDEWLKARVNAKAAKSA